MQFPGAHLDELLETIESFQEMLQRSHFEEKSNVFSFKMACQ